MVSGNDGIESNGASRRKSTNRSAAMPCKTITALMGCPSPPRTRRTARIGVHDVTATTTSGRSRRNVSTIARMRPSAASGILDGKRLQVRSEPPHTPPHHASACDQPTLARQPCANRAEREIDQARPQRHRGVGGRGNKQNRRQCPGLIPRNLRCGLWRSRLHESPDGLPLKSGMRRPRTERSTLTRDAAANGRRSFQQAPPEPELSNRQMAEEAYGFEARKPLAVDLITSSIDVLLQAIQQRVSLVVGRRW